MAIMSGPALEIWFVTKSDLLTSDDVSGRKDCNGLSGHGGIWDFGVGYAGMVET